MNKSVKPLQVSPLIKGSRWTLLGFGIIYGIYKKGRYTAQEIRERPIREKEIKEKHEARLREAKESAIKEIYQLGQDFEQTYYPPGWDDDL